METARTNYTVVKLRKYDGREIVVKIKDDDATIEAIAEAVRSLTFNGISEGDTITVRGGR